MGGWRGGEGGWGRGKRRKKEREEREEPSFSSSSFLPLRAGRPPPAAATRTAARACWSRLHLVARSCPRRPRSWQRRRRWRRPTTWRGTRARPGGAVVLDERGKEKKDEKKSPRSKPKREKPKTPPLDAPLMHAPFEHSVLLYSLFDQLVRSGTVFRRGIYGRRERSGPEGRRNRRGMRFPEIGFGLRDRRRRRIDETILFFFLTISDTISMFPRRFAN